MDHACSAFKPRYNSLYEGWKVERLEVDLAICGLDAEGRLDCRGNSSGTFGYQAVPEPP
jgi:hypothetical protein